MSPAELTQAVEDNLRHLGLEVLEVVNLRSMLSPHGPVEGSLEAPLATLLELKERGLIRHIGLSKRDGKAGRVCAENDAPSSACKIFITLPIAPTTRWWMRWPPSTSPGCPFSRWAVLRRCRRRS
ncbi:aldo-keto reductase [Klebsiella pneumoniae]|uniref:Aldo-keto reductase n=1 Tax=Klebsiella pneumoniae TaxID=573 RepID=A0A447RQG1_KLEPN|nr:aldo-keto reductase [Klebsiella pneumoniae]